MLAIDTNLIVRFLAADHPEQSSKARRLIDTEEVFVCTTVLLETEWVLRSVYGYGARQVGTALTAFAGLPRVRLEDPALTTKALAQLMAGMDFADALHLGRAQACTAFVSFDRRLARKAKRLGEVEVRPP